MAKVYFERYPKGDDVINYVTKEPQQLGSRSITAELAGAKTPLVYVGFHGPQLGSADFYALDLLSMILSFGQSSRFNQNLVNPGLVTAASAYNPDARFATKFITMAVPALKDNGNGLDYAALCDEAKDLLVAEIAAVQENGVTEKELNRVRTIAKRQFIDIMHDNDSLAYVLASYEVYLTHTYLNRYLAELDKLTA